MKFEPISEPCTPCEIVALTPLPLSTEVRSTHARKRVQQYRFACRTPVASHLVGRSAWVLTPSHNRVVTVNRYRSCVAVVPLVLRVETFFDYRIYVVRPRLDAVSYDCRGVPQRPRTGNTSINRYCRSGFWTKWIFSAFFIILCATSLSLPTRRTPCSGSHQRGLPQGEVVQR